MVRNLDAEVPPSCKGSRLCAAVRACGTMVPSCDFCANGKIEKLRLCGEWCVVCGVLWQVVIGVCGEWCGVVWCGVVGVKSRSV